MGRILSDGRKEGRREEEKKDGEMRKLAKLYFATTQMLITRSERCTLPQPAKASGLQDVKTSLMALCVLEAPLLQNQVTTSVSALLVCNPNPA